MNIDVRTLPRTRHTAQPNSRAIARRSRLVFLSVLLLLAHTLVAQSLDAVLDRGSFSHSAREEIAALVETASEAGISEGLLLPRIEEGIAKRVPSARIITTLRREIALLHEAESILLEAEASDLLSTSSVWARAANLLSAGVGPDAVRRLAASARGRPQTFRPASTLLVSLLEWGIDEPSATDLACAAARSRLEVDDYPIVLDLIVEGRVSRVDVDETIELLLELIPEVDSARELRRSMPW